MFQPHIRWLGRGRDPRAFDRQPAPKTGRKASGTLYFETVDLQLKKKGQFVLRPNWLPEKEIPNYRSSGLCAHLEEETGRKNRLSASSQRSFASSAPLLQIRRRWHRAARSPWKEGLWVYWDLLGTKWTPPAWEPSPTDLNRAPRMALFYNSGIRKTVEIQRSLFGKCPLK